MTDPTGTLAQDVDILIDALDQWTQRTNRARACADVAVELIDEISRRPHTIRRQLAADVATYDQELLAEGDALLARIRTERDL